MRFVSSFVSIKKHPLTVASQEFSLCRPEGVHLYREEGFCTDHTQPARRASWFTVKVTPTAIKRGRRADTTVHLMLFVSP
jgi:hypothetical protein